MSLGAVIADQPENWPNFISFGDQYGLNKLKTELKQTYADHVHLMIGRTE